MEGMCVVALRLGSFDIQHERLFLVQETITADAIRKKYNKCINVLKNEKLDKPFQNEEDFIVDYLNEEYGWIPVVPNFIVHDSNETYGKIESEEYNKVYLEER